MKTIVGETCGYCGQAITGKFGEDWEIVDPCPSRLPSWIFTIPHKLSSANKHLVNAGPSRWAYKRDRDTWTRWLQVEKANKAIPAAQGKRHVDIVRIYSGREREWDEDNIAIKALLDAMVLVGLLVDDSPRWVTFTRSQERAEESGVRISIKEAA